MSSPELAGGMIYAKGGLRGWEGRRNAVIAPVLRQCLGLGFMIHSLCLQLLFLSVPKIDSCLLLARIRSPSVRLNGNASPTYCPRP